MQTTGGHSSWLNGKVERSHQTITNMFNTALHDAGHHQNKWCLACEDMVEVYNNLRHSSIKDQPNYIWYHTRSSIHDFCVWGCEIYVKNHGHKALDDRGLQGYFMGYTSTRCIIRWWNPQTNKLSFTTAAKFNEVNFLSYKGKPSPGSLLQQNKPVDVNTLPTVFLKIEYCEYFNLSYIHTAIRNKTFGNIFLQTLTQTHGLWLLIKKSLYP